MEILSQTQVSQTHSLDMEMVTRCESTACTPSREMPQRFMVGDL